eukprot:TRINITY_DN4292_c0_g1_i1.p1 TRINITY_DN4292_c0_g1~~TRINITY_DN4292_c0_g1_i1.p1  ORF type:complete len:358 (-),score=88.94 TRINITY_DN4292_c0_g1_i1:907-1836(-)
MKRNRRISLNNFEENERENESNRWNSSPDSFQMEEGSSSSDEDSNICLGPTNDLLPLEMMLEIFSWMTPRDLSRISLVCSNWRNIANDNELWKRLYTKTCTNENVNDKKYRENRWKKLYRYSILWKWSSEEQMRASEILLSDTGRTASSQQNKAWATCLGSLSLSHGKYYFEIMVDKTSDDTNSIKVVFGCINGPLNLKSNVPFGCNIRDRSSWCYCGDGLVMLRGLPDTLKGQPYNAGDRIGMKLNFFKKSISFYKNGKIQGRKATGISGDLYPAVSLIDGNQVTILRPLEIPSSRKKRRFNPSLNSH